MRNRIVTVICILSLAFGLVACGNKDDVKDTSAPTTETTTVETETSSQEETASQESTEVVKDETETETTPATEENDVEVVASGKLSDASIEWKIVGTTLFVSGTGTIPDFECSPFLTENFADEYSAEQLRDWQKYFNMIEKVVIEEGITKIGERNFEYFLNMKEIVFADSVVELGKWSFRKSGIADLNFNNITTLGQGVFQETYELSSVRISGNIKTIPRDCFMAAPKLSSVYIEEGVTSLEIYSILVNSDNCDIYLPASVTNIHIDAINSATVHVKAGSYAEEFFNENSVTINCTMIVE